MANCSMSIYGKFYGKLFIEHLWQVAYAWTPEAYDEHIATIEALKPQAVMYSNTHHKRLWSRSKLSTHSKVDYVTNNLAKCFNNWNNKHKGLMLFDLMDKVRTKVMAK